MLRIWCSLVVVCLLAACSSMPQRDARSSTDMNFRAPRPFAPPKGFPHFVDHSIGREEISIEAMSLVGVPYRWGGNTPRSGFDCSGLVRYVIGRAADVDLPRTTAEISRRGESIAPDEIAPGDLIFFNTTGRPHSHVGIYVGKLQFVNAPSTGGTVRLDYLTNPYWAKHFDGIRRVAPPKRAPTPFDTPVYEANRGAAPARAAAPTTAVPQSVAPAAAPDAPDRVASAAPPLTRAARAAPVTASADRYEPPPSSMRAAQRQAQAAGAISPSVAAASGGDARNANDTGVTFAATGTAATSAVAAAANASPDPIDAAADAYEPLPPTAAAARQAARLASPGNVEVIRASTAARSVTPAATGTSDDPIARFANGGD